MNTANWIAGGALVVSIIALWLTWRERNFRVEEISLLRRQVEGEESTRAASKSADLYAKPGAIHGGISQNMDQHNFTIANGGQAIAREVFVWARDQEGNDVTARIHAAATLPPGASGVEIKLLVPMPLSRAGGLTLWANWTDDTGPCEEALISIAKHG
jgi:hypothetical protein